MLVIVGCTEIRRPSSQGDARRDPASAWNSHRAYLAEVLESGSYEQPEFDEAIHFFEGLTGIPSGLDGSSLVGRVLEPEPLKAVLIEWDRWYVSHADRIKWDAQKSRYVVGNNAT